MRTIGQIPDHLDGVTAEHVVVIARELEAAGVIQDDFLRCDSVEELFGSDPLLVIRKPILILEFKKACHRARADGLVPFDLGDAQPLLQQARIDATDCNNCTRLRSGRRPFTLAPFGNGDDTVTGV